MRPSGPCNGHEGEGHALAGRGVSDISRAMIAQLDWLFHAAHRRWARCVGSPTCRRLSGRLGAL
eukprot:6609067-Alexandrium_andersonii.AAC.1